jgi:hypothetical protein
MKVKKVPGEGGVAKAIESLISVKKKSSQDEDDNEEGFDYLNQQSENFESEAFGQRLS